MRLKLFCVWLHHEWSRLLVIAEVPATLQVAEVVLMAVGLLFKTDVVVGLQRIAVPDKEYKPLYAVPDEERQVEQFALLGHMNQLVVQLTGIQAVCRENQLAQGDGQKVPAKKYALNFQNLWHFVEGRGCKDTYKRVNHKRKMPLSSVLWSKITDFMSIIKRCVKKKS